MSTDPFDRRTPAEAEAALAGAPDAAADADAVELVPVAPVTSELLRRRARAGCDRRHRPVPADVAPVDGAR